MSVKVAKFDPIITAFQFEHPVYIKLQNLSVVSILFLLCKYSRKLTSSASACSCFEEQGDWFGIGSSGVDSSRGAS